MSTLFISDLHLAPERPKITRAFFSFLENEAVKADALYILGDLFEAWIGDDDPSPFCRDVIQKLSALTRGTNQQKGTPTWFQHGNRDFLVGRRFARETGCILMPEHHVIDLYGTNVLLLHGDTLCTRDLAYQKFRRKVRNPVGTWLLAHLPLKKRLAIASDWRMKSMNANTNKSDNIMDVTPDEVERLMKKYQVRHMIHGHTHRPGQHRHANGERTVLGDWHDKGWVLEADANRMNLRSFPIPSAD